ncbi:hypothetical protein BCR44DRAFT_400878 [Catenaria anguillulae PL171]|uniref:Uncharacterized protein n=1 Tax=Catenaria anguillulae PL171 TaxID=765915 RepID=A0A1Y2HIJ9_9FUNG|nr:hypothetical protein BCR44DRAFT_400878 [Catenaria anguillulae PL171]
MPSMCTSTPTTYLLPHFEHTLYQTLSVTSPILAVFNLSLYFLLTHVTYQPSFHFSPQRSVGRRGWLLIALSLCFIGQACNDMFHAHMSPCFPAVRLWPEYMSIRLAFQAPVGGIAALVQLERASSICLKDYKIRQRLWMAGLVLNLVITPMNVVLTAMDAIHHEGNAGYWAQYQGADWLYYVNFVFPIVGVGATIWTTRIAFSSSSVVRLKTKSGSSSGNVSSSTSRASASGKTAAVGIGSDNGLHIGSSISQIPASSASPHQPLASTGKCLSLRFLQQNLPGPTSSPSTPTPSAVSSPIQSSILFTFKFLSVMSILSWVVGSAMVLGASQMSAAPRFCVAAMSGFPGLTVEILFKRLVRLRRSRRRQGTSESRRIEGGGGAKRMSGASIENHPLESHIVVTARGEEESFEVRCGVERDEVQTHVQKAIM